MNKVPKIVHDRLQTGSPAQAESAKAHPDADLLAGFAEQALSELEREGVLAHLALCENCREVVLLALPAANASSASNAAAKDTDPARVSLPGTLSPRKAVLFGSTMRLVALAAAVVVVASVMLMRPGKLNGPTPVAVNPQVETLRSTTSPAATLSSRLSASDGLSTDDQAKNDKARSASLVVAKKRAAATDHAMSGTLLAGNRKDSNQSDGSSLSLASTSRSSLNSKALHPTAETGEVSSATVAAESEASSANNILAFNDSPPIEKAKPALQEPALQDQDATTADQTSTETGGAVPFTKTQNSKELYAAKPSSATERAFAGNSAWIIKSGVLHRSSDNGLNWQEALRGEHPLLCYLNRGTDVWAGGQAGTLFHSADGGLNWSRVQPSVGFLALTSDITSIAAIGVSAIEVSTSASERWTTLDSGKTWTKK
jgi:hypothetical protein